MAFLCLVAKGQSPGNYLGPSVSAKAGAVVASRNEWSAFHNPAGTVDHLKEHSLQAGMVYSKLNQDISLPVYGLMIMKSMKPGTVFMAIDKFGNDIYNISNLGLGFAKGFSNGSFGIRLNATQRTNELQGSKHAFSLDFGGIYDFSEKLAVGASFEGIGIMGDAQACAKTGVAYVMNKFEFSYQLEMIKAPAITAQFIHALGIEWNSNNEKISAFGGVGTSKGGTELGFGMGLNALRHLNISIATNHNFIFKERLQLGLLYEL